MGRWVLLWLCAVLMASCQSLQDSQGRKSSSFSILHRRHRLKGHLVGAIRREAGDGGQSNPDDAGGDDESSEAGKGHKKHGNKRSDNYKDSEGASLDSSVEGAPVQSGDIPQAGASKTLNVGVVAPDSSSGDGWRSTGAGDVSEKDKEVPKPDRPLVLECKTGFEPKLPDNRTFVKEWRQAGGNTRVPLHLFTQWNYLSIEDWDDMVFKLVHLIPGFHDGPDVTLFNAASGVAAFVRTLRKRFPLMKVAGCDISRQQVAVANAAVSKGSFCQTEATNFTAGMHMSQLENQFDYVVSNGGTLHLHTQEEIMRFARECVKVLKPGGWILFTKNNDMDKIKRIQERPDLDSEHIVDDRHKSGISPSIWKQAAEWLGVKDVQLFSEQKDDLTGVNWPSSLRYAVVMQKVDKALPDVVAPPAASVEESSQDYPSSEGGNSSEPPHVASKPTPESTDDSEAPPPPPENILEMDKQSAAASFASSIQSKESEAHSIGSSSVHKHHRRSSKHHI